MLNRITPEMVEKAHATVAKRVESVIRPLSFKLKGGCMLWVNTRGIKTTTREEAFIGDEEFVITGTFIKATNYNERKSFVILKPKWAADFSNLHLTFEEAEKELSGFSEALWNLYHNDSMTIEALALIERARTEGVIDASQESIDDDRFGSW